MNEKLINERFDELCKILPSNVVFDEYQPVDFCQSTIVSSVMQDNEDCFYLADALLKILFYNPQLGIQNIIPKMEEILNSYDINYVLDDRFGDLKEAIKNYIHAIKYNLVVFSELGPDEYYINKHTRERFDCFKDAIDNIYNTGVEGSINRITKLKKKSGWAEARNLGYIVFNKSMAVIIASNPIDEKGELACEEKYRTPKIINSLENIFKDIECEIPDPFLVNDLVINKATGEIGFVTLPRNEEEQKIMINEFLVKVYAYDDFEPEFVCEKYFPLISTEMYKIDDTNLQFALLKFLGMKNNKKGCE